MDEPIYLISGHGDEDIIDYERRNHLPRGYTMVTFCNCDESVLLDKIYEIFRLFTLPDAHPLLSHPEEMRNHPDFRDFNIRIYHEGQNVPTIKTSLQMAWRVEPGEEYAKNADKGSDYTHICKSGIFQFPLSPEILYDKEHDFAESDPSKRVGFCSNHELSKDKAVQGSIVNRIPKIIQKAYTSFRTVNFSSDMIMNELGQGIYFFPICRKGQCGFTAEEDTPEYEAERATVQQTIQRTRRMSDAQQQQHPYASLSQDALSFPIVPSGFPLSKIAKIRMNTLLRTPSTSDADRAIIQDRLQRDEHIQQELAELIARFGRPMIGKGKSRKSMRRKIRRRTRRRHKRRKTRKSTQRMKRNRYKRRNTKSSKHSNKRKRKPRQHKTKRRKTRR